VIQQRYVSFRDSYSSRQSNVHQLRRQSLQCSFDSSPEQSADGPQIAGLVIQPFQTVTEDILSCQWYQSAACVNAPLTALYYCILAQSIGPLLLLRCSSYHLDIVLLVRWPILNCPSFAVVLFILFSYLFYFVRILFSHNYC